MLLEHNFAVREPIIDALRKLSDDKLRNKEKSINCVMMSIRTASIVSQLPWKNRKWERESTLKPYTLIHCTMWRVYDGAIRRWASQWKKALVQLATHEIHHRGLIVGLIRQFGYEPPDVNMLWKERKPDEQVFGCLLCCD